MRGIPPYKSVSICLKHQGHTVEPHTFINNVEIYKINIIIQLTGPPTSGGGNGKMQ
jgi:hypothetical protein